MLQNMYNIPKNIKIMFDQKLPMIVSDYESDELTDNQRYLLKYFNRIKGEETFIRRVNFNPAEVTHLLPQISIISPIFDEKGIVKDAQFILMGTMVAHFYGDMTNKKMNENLNERQFLRAIVCIEMVLKTRKPITIYNGNVSNNPENKHQTHSLFFPLSDDGKTINKIIALTEISKKPLK